MTFAEELGENIRSARLDAGLTQVQLARMMSVNHVCISNWENGKRFPNPEMLSLIRAALGIKVDDILPKRVIVSKVDENQTTIFDVIGKTI